MLLNRCHRCSHTFSNLSSSSTCVFNRKGTRLLEGRAKQPLTVVDIPSLTGDGATGGQVRLSSEGYSLPGFGRNIFCFAGWDDDLVVSASKDNNLYIWSLPESQVNDSSVNQSLLELRGHTSLVYAVWYDPCNDVLASAGRDNVIKLWTPIAQQQWFIIFYGTNEIPVLLTGNLSSAIYRFSL